MSNHENTGNDKGIGLGLKETYPLILMAFIMRRKLEELGLFLLCVCILIGWSHPVSNL